MENKIYRPKTYTHIDYEALLIYAMKHKVSIEQAIEENNLTIARSTVIRNIKKMADDGNQIVSLYQNGYVPNMQKKKLPEDIKTKIEKLESKQVTKGNELDDVYRKLSTMEKIIENCNGNVTEATRKINSGETPLGNVGSITHQGLLKDMKYLEKIRQRLETERVNKEKNKISEEESKGEEK